MNGNKPEWSGLTILNNKTRKPTSGNSWVFDLCDNGHTDFFCLLI